jgi:hypothetical protein
MALDIKDQISHFAGERLTCCGFAQLILANAARDLAEPMAKKGFA